MKLAIQAMSCVKMKNFGVELMAGRVLKPQVLLQQLLVK